jgi:hypothetical protein
MTKRETKFAMLTAAVAVVAMLSGGGAAEAASLSVTGGTTIAMPGNNDFGANLIAAGATFGLIYGGTLNATGPGTVTYTYMAAESGFTNTFNVYTQGSYALIDLEYTATEANEAWAANALIGSQSVVAGALSVEFTGGTLAQNGATGFGVYLTSNPNLVFLGYDDSGAGPDSDYDDMIIKVEFAPSPVPVPAAIPLFLSGLAAMGLINRRKAA